MSRDLIENAALAYVFICLVLALFVVSASVIFLMQKTYLIPLSLVLFAMNFSSLGIAYYCGKTDRKE